MTGLQVLLLISVAAVVLTVVIAYALSHRSIGRLLGILMLIGAVSAGGAAATAWFAVDCHENPLRPCRSAGEVIYESCKLDLGYGLDALPDHARRCECFASALDVNLGFRALEDYAIQATISFTGIRYDRRDAYLVSQAADVCRIPVRHIGHLTGPADTLLRACVASERRFAPNAPGPGWRRCECFIASVERALPRRALEDYAAAVRLDPFALGDRQVMVSLFTPEQQAAVDASADQCQVYSVLREAG